MTPVTNDERELARAEQPHVSAPSEDSVRCPLCEGTGDIWVENLASAIENTTTRAYRCQDCDSVFSWPLEVPAGLYDGIYRSSSELPGYCRYDRYATHCAAADDALEYLADQEDVYWAVTEALARNTRAKSWRIVEIGSGLGYLTAALNQAGYDATGIDISSEAVAGATRRFGAHYKQQDIFDPDASYVGAFDFAIVLETVEHVADPVGFLAAVGRLLTPEGSMLVTTPNRDTHPQATLWRTDPPPIHLYWMTETAVTRIASRIGFAADLLDFTGFNARHRQTIGLNALSTTPPAVLNSKFEPCAPVPMRTRFMERARAFPLLANGCRFVYDVVRPHRLRLTTRSHSLAAVLSPISSKPEDRSDATAV